MEEIKLGFKDYGEIAFDGYGLELMEQNALEFPHEAHCGGLQLGLITGAYEQVIRTGIGCARSRSAIGAEVGAAARAYDLCIYTYNDDIMSVWTAITTNQYINWDAWGLGYNNTLALLFDHLGPENYLDSAAKATINLDIKTENEDDAAGGVNQVILSELVSK